MERFVIAIGCLLALSCHGQNSPNMEMVKIEHIGESDKPIRSLIVCLKERQTDINEATLIVDQSTLDIVNDYVRKNDTGVLTATQVEFGGFKIFRQSSSDNRFYIMPNRVQAIAYFKGLKLSLSKGEDDNSNLQAALDNLILRITY